MAILVKLQTEYIRFMSSLYRDGFLDSQFLELQKLQDDSNRDFVVEMASLYFKEAEKLLNILTMSLQQQVVDFKQLDIDIHQFKGSSSSIGAQRVKGALIAFRNVCKEKNLDGCMQCLQLAKSEHFLVKNKLETLFRVEQQIVAAGGGIPIIS
ncbi:histidine-containing phosphotransfer protein 1-like [Solanum dulcamara]|uniref:histidine-containing phosphotransfer protein 1-like n=1 Tax=Solanum dulcamara TaxID=45834 RepID=UPI0024855F7D|nr:histidine-containing phosphotransfer protein 1-like [Solanum dulcamara]